MRQPTDQKMMLVWQALNRSHWGARYAITQKRLAQKVGLSLRDTRDAVERLVSECDAPIGSTCHGAHMGHFVAADSLELERSIQQMASRRRKLGSRIIGLQRAQLELQKEAAGKQRALF